MEPIYANFDALEVSFQCTLPKRVLDLLAEAQEEARATQKNVMVRLGEKDAIIFVNPLGTQGFTYRFDTSFHAGTWLIVHSPRKDGWNIKVSVKSLALALHGYEGVKERILDFLINDLEAEGISHSDKETGEITNFPLERISSFSFCIDFKTENFIPDFSAFSLKGPFKKRFSEFWKNRKFISELVLPEKDRKYLQIGSPPYRQVIFYEKTFDISEKRKDFWWDIWRIEKSEFKGKIWSIRAIVGKKELNKWNLRKFSDFEEMAGEVISSILKDIRYVDSSYKTENITRKPVVGFWEEAIHIAKEELSLK